MIRRREVLVAAIIAFALFPAPTVGDVGGCGKTATALDPLVYAHAKKSVDCSRCNDCGLTTGRCTRACDPKQPSDVEIPATCHPIFHDGEVCIRALKAASCTEYASFVDDDAPAVPSECDFCRIPPGDGGTP